MVAIRRWYIFLICVISLQSVTWAIIALLSNLLTNNTWDTVTATAFQIAVVTIGLPVFLVHWLWAQNLARKENEEREADLRSLYLYGTLAAFLAPIATNTFDLLATLLGLLLKVQRASYFTFIPAKPTEFITRELVAIGVLTLLWLYHRWITLEDAKESPTAGSSAAARRFYILGFSATGVWTVTMGIINLLRWLMFQADSTVITNMLPLVDDTARLMVGLPLWLIFWRWAQTLFNSSNQEEHQSALRKFYLYATVFIATLTIVSNAIIILADWFKHLFNLSTQYSLPISDFRENLATILGMLILWAYHSIILRHDATHAGEEPRQAEVRRLYLYLVAGIGLAAFLIGLSGEISVLIRLGAEPVINDTLTLKDQLTWFTATLFVGLPVWLFPWRQSQTIAIALTTAGAGERRSTTRKIYLYFYLFVATISALSSAIYIAYRLLSLGLGEHTSQNLLSDLGSAIAYCMIAIGVWLYHGYALRGDGRTNRREQTKQLAALQIAVVDDTDGRFGRSVLEGLRRELPGISLNPIGLTEIAAQAMASTLQGIPTQLAAAGLIIGPSNLTFAGGAVSAEVAQAVTHSTARKLLIPTWTDTYTWIGVDRWPAEAITRQTVRAVKQIIAGDEVKPVRPLGAGAIIGIIIGIILLLILLLIFLVYLYFASPHTY